MRPALVVAAAVLVGLAGCSGTPETSKSSVGSPSPSAGTAAPTDGLVPQEEKMLAVTTGRWAGEAGTLSFRGSKGELNLRACPLVPGGPRFGYTTACAPETVVGRVSVGYRSLGFLLDDDGTETLVYAAYVDGDDRLHIGKGSIAELGPDRQARLNREDNASQVHIEGDNCRRVADLGSGTTVPIPCHWEQRDGRDVLFLGDEVYIADERAQVLATPEVFFGALSR